jgi:Skp family chaperone for outer membrane proteins
LIRANAKISAMRTRIVILAVSLAATIAFVSTARAQVVGQPYRATDREVARLLDRIKSKTNTFRESLKKALNQSRLDRAQREQNINANVKEFEEETKRLDDHFGHHKSTTADVNSVLQRASRIYTFMILTPLDARVQGDWATLRTDLELLASAYNISWQWGAEWRTPPFVDPPNRVSDKQVEELIHRIEIQSDQFRKSLDSALDQSLLDGTRREDDINAFVKEFYQGTKQLHEQLDSHKSTASDVQTVLDRAAQIDQFMRRNRLTGDHDAQRDWAQLRAHLDELARLYNVIWKW